MDPTYWKRLLTSEYAGGRFLIIADSLGQTGNLIRFLDECGAQRPFIVAANEGLGEVPSRDEADWALLGTGGDTTMGVIRAFSQAAADLPPEVLAQIDEWDPDHTARVLDGFLSSATLVAGRPHYGTRRPEWLALEDKTVIDNVWDRADVRRAPSVVVPVAGTDFGRVSAEVDWGAGTVWVGDNTDGWHGGAEYLRWVRSHDDAVGARLWFAGRCEQVRVMPFLEGIPCSVHGFVFPDYVAAVRPIEMLVVRKRGTTELKYTGTASIWDPPPADRADMRGIARRVGRVLRADYGYAGGFTVDGVMTESGFLPTELNSRMGAGIGRAARGVPELALGAINRALIERVDVDYRPQAFEQLLVTGADEHRSGIGFLMVDAVPDSKQEQGVVFDDGTCRLVRPGETPDAVVTWDKGSPAGSVAVRPDPDRVAIGESLAPLVVAGFQVADRIWDLGLPPFEPAREVRHLPA